MLLYLVSTVLFNVKLQFLISIAFIHPTHLFCLACAVCRRIFEELSKFAEKLKYPWHPRSAKVPHVADFKSAYISLIIGPRGLQCETNL